MRRSEKTYVAMDKDAKRELGRYTTVEGLKRAMERRGIARGDYRIFQIKM